MSDDSYEVREEEIERIKAKPESERTGYEVAALGIDRAVEAARSELEKAGFELNHLALIYDASETPDKNPQTRADAGMVAVPHHPSCLLRVLLNCAMSIARDGGMMVDLSQVVSRLAAGQEPPQQSGPIGDT